MSDGCLECVPEQGRNFNMFTDSSVLAVTRRHVDLLLVNSTTVCRA